MHFLKALSLFLLLLWGNAGIAFSFPEEDHSSDDQQLSLQVSEDISELFDSTLLSKSITGLRFSSPETTNFYFQSVLVAAEAEKYISFSRFIDPALDATKIIFPFHSFL